MFLFQKRFLAGLVDGTITLTFRSWNKPLVKAGGRYRCHPIGVIEVDAIDRVSMADVSDADAREAGFSDRTELEVYLNGRNEDSHPSEVFRVRLHYAGDGDRVPEAMSTELSRQSLAEIRKALMAFDERSGAPWTAKTLRIIDGNPRVAASKLAAKLGRETAAFKADVVKLKRLGLTQSFEVGYEISPRGRAYLDSRKRRR
ncbi:MAG: ASCH domain-containing protein [Acidobacteriota bacterium]